MKFKFLKDIEYQKEAIDSVTLLFETGKNLSKNEDTFILKSASKVIANELEIDKKIILNNLQLVQEQNQIPKQEELNELDFTIEMETGTGKTYVYLRTILELNRKYNLKKFIILVPSVAIREGVLKTIEQTKEHFREIYNTNFGHFVYDSGKLNKVSDFAQSNDIQIIIMTVQSFKSDNHIMNQKPDRFYGERPIDIVASTKPIVIMDEPQNMESDLSHSAIDKLTPLIKFRYSATHKKVINPIFKLGPIEAYKKGLVKKVEVYGAETKSTGDFIFDVKGIITKKGESPKAKIKIEVKNVDEYVMKEIILGQGDDIYIKSKKNEKYKNIYIREIDASVGVEISDGRLFKVIKDNLEDKESLFRTQIRETIKRHIQKQDTLGNQIKVLSLFFIDEVKNYRGENPIIEKIFEEEFNELKNRSEFFKSKNTREVHKGYFSQDRQSESRKSQEVNSEGKRDKLTYDLIMKNKEQLLSFEENTSFIFSHSALKEGWDNPNIFQICTLIETKDDFTKRQKIGRGLRLPVDINGNRIYDAEVNVLTVIANESYEDFANTLQKEYEEAGYKNVNKPSNAKDGVNVEFKKDHTHFADFKNLWEKINQKTKFNIEIDEKELVKNCIEKINENIKNPLTAVVINKAKIIVDEKGIVKTVFQNQTIGDEIKREVIIKNFIERLTNDTGLTRKTIYEIISSVGNLDYILKNPEDYIRNLINIIDGCKSDLLINEGIKYLPTDDFWKMELFIDIKNYKSETEEGIKSIYSRIIYDSEGEREFAKNLEERDDVLVFVKLPHKFVIDTPLGTYNPDWAIVLDEDGDKKLYLVRETKFVADINNLRPSESKKIICGEKHFKAINFDGFKISTKSDLIDLI